MPRPAHCLRRALAGAAFLAAWSAVVGVQGAALAAQVPDTATAHAGAPMLGELPVPLTFEVVRARILAANPQLAAARSRAAAVAAGVPEASTLPDPMLQFGAMNVGLPELNADMPMSMAPTVQLMQRLPLAGKLGLRGEMAEREASAWAAMADEMVWLLHARAATAFQRLGVIDRQLEVQRETVRLLESFRTVAAARYASGEGRQADVLRADVEVGRARSEIARLQALRVAASARLNALMNRSSDAPVPSVVAGATPSELPSLDALAARAESTRPALAAGQARVDGARTGTELARRELWPDLSVGVQYGTRADESGRDHMGGLTLGVSLPVFASRRQLPRREQAAAELQAAEAELVGTRVEIRASLQEALAEVERARTLLELYDGEILPTARAAVESALAAYRAGAADFPALLDTQLALNRFEMERHALAGDERIALAAVEAMVGSTLNDEEIDR